MTIKNEAMSGRSLVATIGATALAMAMATFWALVDSSGVTLAGEAVALVAICVALALGVRWAGRDVGFRNGSLLHFTGLVTSAAALVVTSVAVGISVSA